MTIPFKLPLHDMTRELWAKYTWLDVTSMDDEFRMVQRGHERAPGEAKEAWEEFDVFERLHQKEESAHE